MDIRTTGKQDEGYQNIRVPGKNQPEILII
jgi:hypothetical protein